MVSADKPVLTLSYGYHGGAEMVGAIHETLGSDVEFYMFDLSHEQDQALPPNAHHIHGRGILRYYHALADLSLNGHNLSSSPWRLHNFVEETEGGPHFLVPPDDVRQYGYAQLQEAGVVRECEDFSDLLEKIQEYVALLRSPASRAALRMAHRKARNAHLRKTRKTYMPLLSSCITTMLSDPAELVEAADLRIERIGNCVRVIHPETVWVDEDSVPSDQSN